MQPIRVSGQRLWQSIMDMARIGPTAAGGSCRLALSDQDREGRDLFRNWCDEAGLSMQIDRLGNMFARRDGVDKILPPVAIGSHLDTQPHGGRFDGIYGVLAGLEVVRALNDHNLGTRAPLEVVNWTNEEGARFAPAMLCSGVYAGVFDLEFALARTDIEGKAFGDELQRIGYAGCHKCGEHKIGALLEAHIEQGPILEDNNELIGVVVGGQGQKWFNVSASGRDSHAGSTPMPGRKDALVAAARAVMEVQSIALAHPPHGVGTVGSMQVHPDSRNTIPGRVDFTVEFRHPRDDMVIGMSEMFRARLDTMSQEGPVLFEMEQIWHSPPAVFDERCIGAVENAVAELGYSSRRMISGAGHDACQVSRVAPTSMVFVPCKDGLSHNEAESAEPEHLEAGANVLLLAALQLAGSG